MIDNNNNQELYKELCSYDNLYLAYTKARRGKTLKPYVMEFEKDLQTNLLALHYELLNKTYSPRPLHSFIIRDPKTRKISKSDFRDRVIHHAICNIIEPMFEKSFIYDSFANRKGKGTLKAIGRFDYFKRKASMNNSRNCFFLKADVRHYFDTVDHITLFQILERKIKDQDMMALIKKIIGNYKTERMGKGMPLGNLTSQFFANVYLNELDQFVKHVLREKYYIRYVDDFMILSHDKQRLEDCKERINLFLKNILLLELHPDKSKVLPLEKGAGFLGFRIFYYHKLVKKKNIDKFERKLNMLKDCFSTGKIDRTAVIEMFQGWLAYISHADMYKYRRHLVRKLNINFPIKKSIKLTEIKKHENHIKISESSEMQYSSMKTLLLFNRGLSIDKISGQRCIKESTVWAHLAQLIEYNKLSIFRVIPKEKINKIRPNILSITESLKSIKQKINDDTITYDEIDCILSWIKSQQRNKNILFHVKRFQNSICRKRCSEQERRVCKTKFDVFIAGNPNLKISYYGFLRLFYLHVKICTKCKGK